MPAYTETNQTTHKFGGKRGETPGTRNVSNIFIEDLADTDPFNKLVYPFDAYPLMHIYFCYMT